MTDFRSRTLRVGSRIKEERLRQGWTQKQLAHRLQTSIPQLSQWENGWKIPSPHSLLMIASAMELPLQTLLGDISDLSSYHFGERLRTVRNVRGMTLQDLSSQVGYSHVTVSLWERGAVEPKAGDVGKLAQALNVTCDYLIYGQGWADKS